jgi:SET domain-containing protein
LGLHHLHIKPSTVVGGGKGLFALDPKQPADAVIFKKGDIVVSHGGEMIDTEELKARYGDKTASYGAYLKEDVYLDAARKRGAGSLVNHSSKPNARPVGAFNTKPQCIKLKATQSIKNNTEIFVSYERSYHFNEHTTHTTK